MHRGCLLFFADVDNLKEINDTYGHQEGDLAIVHAADALEQTFRNSDVIAVLAEMSLPCWRWRLPAKTGGHPAAACEKSIKGSNAGESRYELSLSVGMSRFDPKNPVSLENSSPAR